MPADRRHEPTKRITAPPGSPEYEQQMLQQGQHAMDRALAMPLVRLLFGLFFAMTASAMIAGALEAYLTGGWRGVVNDVDSWLGMDLVLLIPSGMIAFTGRSRRKWFIELFQSRRSPPKTARPSGVDCNPTERA